MQSIRQIHEDAPEFIPVPEALRHRRVEIILWPLDPASTETDERLTDYERIKVDRIEIPSRDERHARRPRKSGSNTRQGRIGFLIEHGRCRGPLRQ